MIDNKQRVFIDLSRGVAVFLMLWGHCIQYCIANSGKDFFEDAVFRVIYSFHMPLFMLISGYLFYFSFNKRDMGELLEHRCRTLVHPIVFGTLFTFVATDVLFGFIDGHLGILFTGGWIQELPSLWFLWSVLAASVSVALICKNVRPVWLQILLLGVFTILVAVFPNMTYNIYMYPYFIIGFYFAKYKESVRGWLAKLRYLSVIAFPVMLCFYGKEHYIYTTGLFEGGGSLMEALWIDTYRWAIGLVGSVFALTVLYDLYRSVTLKIKKPIISDALSKLGSRSLQIYVISVPFLSRYLQRWFPVLLELFGGENVFTRNMIVYDLVFTLGLSVVYAVVLYLIVRLFERSNVSRVLFGK